MKRNDHCYYRWEGVPLWTTGFSLARLWLCGKVVVMLNTGYILNYQPVTLYFVYGPVQQDRMEEVAMED